jgi:PAS domain S-box-containing protein
VFSNPAALAALGYDDAAEVLGRPAHQTVHYKRPDGSLYPVDECPMLRPRTTGETVHTEDDWFVRRDGSMFPVAWWSAPLEMPNGLGAVVAFTEITDRLKAERTTRERDAANIRAAEARAAQRRGVDSERAIRRQVAQDLHDGAQQRLVTLLIALQLAREAIDDSGQAGALLRQAHDQAQEAIAELRQLAAGIYPAILTNRGLAAAVSAFGDHAPFPVTVTDTTASRFPETVEAQGYFLVAEALTNAFKHAHATRADVRLEVENDILVISVSDDGVGGAAASTRGTGLLGLADRLAALSGTLEVTSPPGAGTTVRASIPYQDMDRALR